MRPPPPPVGAADAVDAAARAGSVDRVGGAGAGAGAALRDKRLDVEVFAQRRMAPFGGPETSTKPRQLQFDWLTIALTTGPHSELSHLIGQKQ